MKQTRRTKYFPLKGGEDLVTPIFNKPLGSLRGSRNFECDPGGRYRRIQGYERFDGQPSPTEAVYYILYFDAADAEIAAEDVVTGATSGATATALVDAVVESGSYVGGDAAGYLVLIDLTGTFQDNENLQVAAVTKSVANGVASVDAGGATNHNTWYRAAVALRRAVITAVPGSGDVLGVVELNQTTYAFRNNAGGTATDLYKSSTSGWTQVDLGEYIYFDAGTAVFTEGQVLTGGTSGATATVRRVVLTGGTWAGGDAEGYVVTGTVTGTFQDDEAITDALSGAATANGANTAITLSSDGRYDFDIYNFKGHSGSKRIYGCDGVNNGFEFDGSVYVPIFTGMTSDKPQHIKCVKNYLFFSFSGGSLQNSSLGDPLVWSAVTGASETGLGDEITGLQSLKKDTIAVIGDSKISVLFPYSTGWTLETFTQERGGVEWSMQKGTDLYFLDSAGISSMAATDAYGDFESGSISELIQPLLEKKLQYFLSSLSVQNKEQIRLFFTDKTGIVLTFAGGTPVGFTQIEYDHKVCCAWRGKTSGKQDFLLFGSDNGMVYHLDKGTSFDGEAINSFFRTWPVTLGNPERKKRFFKIAIERDSSITEGLWGIGSWGGFEWGDQSLGLPYSYIDEADTGYSYSYTAEETWEEPYTLQGIIIHYSEGGLKR